MLGRVDEPGLRSYLEEIGQYAILTKEAEFELGRRIREHNDDDAKETLILANLRIVVYIAKKFQNQGLRISELINAGNEGLVHAAGHFDERKGYRFNTYSVWWIKRAIYEAINQERGIVTKSYLAKRLQNATQNFIRQHGREPDVEELAKVLKVSASAVSLALTELIPPYSLDETFEHDDVETPYIETVWLDIENANKLTSPAPEEVFKKKVEREKLGRAISQLAPREQEVLRRNFGMDDFETQTLEDISRTMKITRERVRQIRENALRKLRSILLQMG